MLNMKRLGTRIAFLRKKANLRQWQVAERCGVSIQAVSKWETGLNCPDLLLLDDSEGFSVRRVMLRGEWLEDRK